MLSSFKGSIATYLGSTGDKPPGLLCTPWVEFSSNFTDAIFPSTQKKKALNSTRLMNQDLERLAKHEFVIDQILRLIYISL